MNGTTTMSQAPQLDLQRQIAQVLISIGAVGFTTEKPITFKSGIISPVYVDNRKLPYHPEKWQLVIQGFASLLETNKISFDIVAGIETAGIPHSAALGYFLQKPSIFVRKKIKDHGTKSRVEGGSVMGKRVVLLEDLITTGGSSLAGVEALREQGAVVEDCLVIVSYGFEESVVQFAAAGVKLRSLTTFPVILDVAVEQGKINQQQKKTVQEWYTNPHGWGKK